MKQSIIRGTLILTAAGLIGRCMGFFYKIFLATAIGADELGLYQIIFPLLGVAMSICSMGIEAAISRFVAGEQNSDGIIANTHNARTPNVRQQNSDGIFTAGLVLSLALSIPTAAVLVFFREQLAVRLLFNEKAAALITPMAASIPLSCIHQCICSYYYGKNSTKIPALSQVFEQLVRVFAVFATYRLMLANNFMPNATLAVIGVLAGEIGACAFSFPAIKKSGVSLSFLNFSTNIRRIATFAFPLSCNRLLLSLLQSGEAVLVPMLLMAGGMEESEALAVFGVLTGMALSFITFPATITQSAALMLLPATAHAQSAHNEKMIGKYISASILVSLNVGIFCTGGFLFYGSRFGSMIFKNNLVYYIMQPLSFLCPFLYLNTTLTGIINGLGKTTLTFGCNLAGVAVRLCFIIFAMPGSGLAGYMAGLLASNILVSGIYTAYLFSTHLKTGTLTQSDDSPENVSTLILALKSQSQALTQNGDSPAVNAFRGIFLPSVRVCLAVGFVDFAAGILTWISQNSLPSVITSAAIYSFVYVGLNVPEFVRTVHKKL